MSKSRKNNVDMSSALTFFNLCSIYGSYFSHYKLTGTAASIFSTNNFSADPDVFHFPDYLAYNFHFHNRNYQFRFFASKINKYCFLLDFSNYLYLYFAAFITATFTLLDITSDIWFRKNKMEYRFGFFTDFTRMS